MAKRKYFPCPWCKGRGGYTEAVLDDGSGPYYPCYSCNDEGQIEIGSETHVKLFFNSETWYGTIYHFDGREFSEEGDFPSLTDEQVVHIAAVESQLRALWRSFGGIK